jgi:photosystem II stability/assembly factor-like uncharacterized protein
MRILRPTKHLLIAAIALASGWSAYADLPAEILPESQRSVLLDMATAGDRVVAVGERGHILLSDDFGQSWRQVATPTRSTLTAVTFYSSQLGWAVGHDNIVLHTRNGGESWQRQYLPIEPDNHMLDVRFLDEQNGLVVGAYGLGFRTENGGRQWEMALISEEEMHINRISTGAAGQLYLALEWGAILKSTDNGRNWSELNSPYDGSLFGLLPLNANTLLIYGLRGNVFRSMDSGETWQAATGTAPVLLIDGLRTANGTIILAGQNGEFFISRDSGRTFSLWKVPVMGASSVLEMPDGAILATGVNGVWRLQVESLVKEDAP